MKKKIAIILLLFIILAAISGCGSKDPIIGQWVHSEDSSEVIEFKKDGTMIFVGSDDPDNTSAWKKEGDTYYLVTKILDEEELWEIEVDGDELTIYIPVLSYIYPIHYTRK